VALSPTFRHSISELKNLYGEGRAAERILSRLKSIKIGPGLIMKKFTDYVLPSEPHE
jgi:hypothetical protein